MSSQNACYCFLAGWWRLKLGTIMSCWPAVKGLTMRLGTSVLTMVPPLVKVCKVNIDTVLNIVDMWYDNEIWYEVLLKFLPFDSIQKEMLYIYMAVLQERLKCCTTCGVAVLQTSYYFENLKFIMILSHPIPIAPQVYWQGIGSAARGMGPASTFRPVIWKSSLLWTVYQFTRHCYSMFF